MTTLTMTPEIRQQELDKVKAKIFVGENSAFLGPLMASLEFVWTDQVETCATDYEHIFWNPADFEKLTFEERVAAYLHELGHNYRLHGLRQGEREQKPWNIAGDIAINRDLKKSGHHCVVTSKEFVGQHPEIKSTVEEDIYDELMKNAQKVPQMGGSCSCHQLPPPTKAQQQAAIRNVVQAVQQAQMAGKPGDVPGNVEAMLNTFLEPQIPWRQHLNQWFNEKLSKFRTYRRPSRRYLNRGMLMKGRLRDEDRLAHLLYFFDVSGSVSDDQVTVFNSEMKFILETYKPRKMTLVLFDTKIQKVIVFESDDDFNELKIVGRGGTSLTCVHQFIQDTEDASAALIFSDLYCSPMEKVKIPVIWVCVDNPGGEVPFGTILHVNSKDLV